MKINKKDLFFTYLIAVIIYFAIVALSIVSAGQQVALPNPLVALVMFLLLGLVPSLVPGGFYFYRNPAGTKEALAISALFGFTLWPLLTIVFMILMELELYLSGLYSPASTPGSVFITPYLSVLLSWLVMGIPITVVTFISYLVVRYLLKKQP